MSVDPKDIVDEHGFDAWLQDLRTPRLERDYKFRREAEAVASRLALRLVPLWWNTTLTDRNLIDNDFTPLPFLRCLLTAIVLSSTSRKNNELKDALQNAVASKEFLAGRSLAVALSFERTLIVDAVRNLAYSVPSSFVRGIEDVFESALTRMGSRASIYVNEILVDFNCLSKGEDVLQAPLWSNSNPIQRIWTEITFRPANKGEPSSWAFWIWWYQSILDGTAPAPNSPMIAEIALLDKDDEGIWEDEPRALKKINEIWQRYLHEEAMELLNDAGEFVFIRSPRVDRSHNHPPELILDEDNAFKAYGASVEILEDIAEELEAPEPDKSKLRDLANALMKAAQVIVTYCGGIGDIALKSGAKVFGAGGGTAAVDAVFNGGRLLDFASKLMSFAGGG